MKKELKDYLHLFGIGCPVSTIDGIGNVLVIHNKAVTVALKCINYNQELHGFSDGNGGLHRTYLLKDDYVKPILSALPNMTEEEIENFFDLDVDAQIVRGNFISPFFQVEYIDDHGERTYEHQYITQLNPEQYRYLLSKHFDLFGLIEAGLAVNAAELKSVSSR